MASRRLLTLLPRAAALPSPATRPIIATTRLINSRQYHDSQTQTLQGPLYKHLTTTSKPSPHPPKKSLFLRPTSRRQPPLQNLRLLLPPETNLKPVAQSDNNRLPRTRRTPTNRLHPLSNQHPRHHLPRLILHLPRRI
ncbi:Thiosulfate sulfurtransferase rdl2, mitochondrial [Podospora bellae-mahoneyi]|uniref:Thiosulfate sulfurtransferase rdl2, mitochondrial n=1 Tax=Podospora bellae-mahoneyi TaxID=2093777 RepID=A0ABR0FKA1_9PEZI|nr:Thiosulfate sulfurtransferase rdl2, mitochondrial [Podospora bellae-mahoneyi]